MQKSIEPWKEDSCILFLSNKKSLKGSLSNDFPLFSFSLSEKVLVLTFVNKEEVCLYKINGKLSECRIL